MKKSPNLTQELKSIKTEVEKLRNTMNLNFDLIGNRVENALKIANEKPKETRLIPFDVEKAKQGAKIVTKCGYDARILCYDSKFADGTQPIIAEIDKKTNIVITNHSEDGAYLYDKQSSDFDLMIKEED